MFSYWAGNSADFTYFTLIGLGSSLITGSIGDVFVVRTSKPVENLRKNGLF